MGHPDWNTSFPLPLGSDSERSASLWLAQAREGQIWANSNHGLHYRRR